MINKNNDNDKGLTGFGEGPRPEFKHESSFQTRAEIIDKATYGLDRHYPDQSAYRPLPLWIKLYALLTLALVVYANITYPTKVALAETGFFFALALHNCIGIFSKPRRKPYLDNLPDKDLPHYTILLPLFQEEHMVECLLHNMCQLDYPKDKLQLLFLVEEDDTPTIRSAKMHTPAFPEFNEVRVLTVPAGQPQTKPRACNYGLHFATGAIVVIYDAEDAPHPLQLREAVSAFNTLGDKYACLQSPLIIEDDYYDMLGHIMGLEYDTLFRQHLPEISNIGLPIPLGGTSNHFRTATLKRLYGWDAFNVTEDADIGVRLYEHGYKTETLFYGTCETATRGLRAHINQRTRWQKGNLQTWMVRLRHPLRSMRRIGLRSYLSFQFVFFGRSIAPLIYLGMLIILASKYMTDINIGEIYTAIGVIGIGTIFASHIICAVKLKRTTHIYCLGFLPIFWIFSVFIFFRALWQLTLNPYRWDKTPHHLPPPNFPMDSI